MKIACVIPTYDHPAQLAETLRSLLGQTRRPDAVYVVDNGGTGDAAPVAARFPEVTYIKLPENTGSAGGFHEGMKAALPAADMLFMSDDDQLYRPDALEQLEKALLSFPPEAMVGAVRCAWENYAGLRPQEVRDSVWAGTLIRAEAARATGLPLRELFLYGDDAEYFRRMGRAGFRLYVIPAARYLRRDCAHKAEIGVFFPPTHVYKSDFRLYYAFRNEIYIYRLYDRPRIIRVLLYFARVMFSLEYAGILAALSGMRDGFMGRLGKNERYSVRR